jgi:hypothetical protein
LVRVEKKSVRAQQEDAIAALLSEPTVEAAAVKAGISVGVLHAWLRNSTFDNRYQAARRASVDAGVADAITQLQQEAASAVDALRRNLTCGVPAVEVEAAKVILEHAVEGLERTESPGQSQAGDRGRAPYKEKTGRD